MKKLYYIMTLMFITLLASCSQQELVDQEGAEGRVSISAELPASIAATRAQIAVPATHQLRCIIEVWTNSTTPALKYRQEVTVASGAFPMFDFALRPGDYNCLMWADFIKKDAATTEMTVEDVTYTHFEDFMYDTSDLRAITIKEEAAGNLFDTDLCDGFYATLAIKKNATAVRQTMQLKRPFAKLIVKESNEEKFATLQGMSLECQLPNSFNVATGEPGKEMMTVTHGKTFEQGDASQVLFTEYVFVPSTGLSMGSFLLAFSTSEGNSRCEIPAGIALKRNQQMVAAGKVMEGGAIETKPDEPGPEPDRDPQVGDYFFIDGTWSCELTDANKAKCVGFVYAVGKQPGDDISNYPDSDGKSIKGYVMALKNAEVKDFLPAENAANYAMSGRPYFYRQEGSNYDATVVEASKSAFKAFADGDWTNYNGYSVTKQILETEIYTQNRADFYHPALAYFEEWNKTVAVKAANASEWYMPSSAQLVHGIGRIFGCAGGTQGSAVVPAVDKNQDYNDAFMKAIELGITSHFPANNSNKGYYIYSLSFSTDPVPHTLQVGYGEEGAGSVLPVKPTFKVQGYIRPVLTIIK